MKFKTKPVGLIVLLSAAAVSILLFQNFTWTGAENLSGSKKCDAAKLKEILAPASANASSVKLNCSVSLRSQDVVTKDLVLEGAAASGINIDCNKGSLGKVLITSVEDRNATKTYGWSRPEKIVLTACKFNGNVRVRGYGNNGEAVNVRESSRLDTNHTLRAQTVAPRQILIENSIFDAHENIALYLAPGTTQVTVQNSTFLGTSPSVAVYLDAESANNRIVQNKFNIKTSRELIAVDGSANNLITKNEFIPQGNASVHIYRNCGEGGTVRHQAPTDNVISSNTFYSDVAESIYVGMRNGRSSYCDYDAGFKFGSSKDDRDFADNNRIISNSFIVNKDKKSKYISRFIIVSGYKTTEITKNKLTISSADKRPFAERVYGAYQDGGGNTITPDKKAPQSQVVRFECAKSNSNSGCTKSISCPDSAEIVSVKAACNLEGTGLVTWNKVNALDENSVNVLRTSDNVSAGLCQVDGQGISKDEKAIKLSSKKKIEVKCREHDKNGGDCVIRGVLTCKA